MALRLNEWAVLVLRRLTQIWTHVHACMRARKHDPPPQQASWAMLMLQLLIQTWTQVYACVRAHRHGPPPQRSSWAALVLQQLCRRHRAAGPDELCVALGELAPLAKSLHK
eukprot:1159088-Pelagomonas_calceolata.AAC.7